MVKTMKIQDKTHERLGKVGNKNQTFDEIINDLLDHYEEGVE